MAIETADAAGITLIAVVRGTDFEIFTHPEPVSYTHLTLPTIYSV